MLDGNREDPNEIEANIYMPNHSMRWKDEETDAQRAPYLVQGHTAGK